MHHHPRTSVLHWALTNRLLYSSMNRQRCFLFTFVAFIYHCLTFTHMHVPIVIFLLRDIATGQNICSARGIFFLSLLQTNNTRPWLSRGHDDTWVCSIFVWMDLVYIKLLFVSVLNYPESNCYQIKSQKCYYPVIQSWQPDQS